MDLTVPEKIQGDLTIKDQRFAVVTARFNEFITSKLLDGALDTLRRHGCREENVTQVCVPGSFEIPLTALKLAQSGRFSAVICLGCVIRGQTPHFEYICSEVTKGVAQVGLQTGVPATFGLITADTLEQAIDRAGAKGGNKGADAAAAAIEMSNLIPRITSG